MKEPPIDGKTKRKKAEEGAVGKWIPVNEVMAILSCTDKHISALLRQGDLTGMKLGTRALRISEESLKAFIAARIINPEDYFAPDEEEPKPTKPTVARSNWMMKR